MTTHDAILGLLVVAVWIVGDKIVAALNRNHAELNRNHAELMQQLQPLLIQFRLAKYESDYGGKEHPPSDGEVKIESMARRRWMLDWSLNQFRPNVLPLAQHVALAIVDQQKGVVKADQG